MNEDIHHIRWEMEDDDDVGTLHVFTLMGDTIVQQRPRTFASLDELPELIAERIRADGRRVGESPPEG